MTSDILDAIDEASGWLDIEGIEGVAEGRHGGKPCIVVGRSLPESEVADKIPEVFRGFPVVLEEWGSISAQDSG